MLIYLVLIDSDEDRSKFEVIYTEYKNLMFYIANRILGDDKDSEDIVHDAFLKVIEIIDKIEVAKCPKTRNLVVIIVERMAIDLYRKRKRRTMISFNEEMINVPCCLEMDSVTERLSVASAIAMLPTTYRELLLLKYDVGLSEAEIAKLLSMAEANVHKTIQRAKKRLSQILDEQEADNR